MTGVCQEFCIQRIQTARWRDIADAQSFFSDAVEERNRYMGIAREKEENIEGKNAWHIDDVCDDKPSGCGNCILYGTENDTE